MTLTEFNNQQKIIFLGSQEIDETRNLNNGPSKLVKARAKIFLFYLVTMLNIKPPDISVPMLRNAIQFEWSLYGITIRNQKGISFYEETEYLEFGIYEDKISMLYVPNSLEKEKNYINYNFVTTKDAKDFYQVIVELFKKGKDFLENFCIDYNTFNIEKI